MATVTKSRGVMHFISRYTGKVVRHLCKVKKKKTQNIKLSTERLHKGIKGSTIEAHCSIEKAADFFFNNETELLISFHPISPTLPLPRFPS